MWSGLLYVLAFRHRSRRGRLGLVNLVFLNLATFFLLFALAETVFAAKEHKGHAARAHAPDQPEPGQTDEAPSSGKRIEPLVAPYVIPHQILGYAPRPGSRAHAVSYEGEHAVYDVHYTIGDDGLRISPPAGGAEQCVLFFGCSFTFGEGVEDDGTMPFLVGVRSAGKFRAFNFGFHGYGPHHMLAALEHGIVDRASDCEPSYVVYQAILAHVNRASGLTSNGTTGPWYRRSEDGTVAYAGDFAQRNGVEDGVSRSRLHAALTASHVYRELHRGTVEYGEHVELMAAIVDTARQRILAKWPECEFHVIFWDERFQLKTLELEWALRRHGFEIHEISDVLPGYLQDKAKYWISPTDRHPNALAHATMANYVVQEIMGGRGLTFPHRHSGDVARSDG